MRKQLLTAQNDCCAYCGLPLGETGKTEIEHLVAKGGPKRPKHVEFTFEVDNLYLSCNLCNSPLKKVLKKQLFIKIRSHTLIVLLVLYTLDMIHLICIIHGL